MKVAFIDRVGRRQQQAAAAAKLAPQPCPKMVELCGGGVRGKVKRNSKKPISKLNHISVHHDSRTEDLAAAPPQSVTCHKTLTGQLYRFESVPGSLINDHTTQKWRVMRERGAPLSQFTTGPTLACRIRKAKPAHSRIWKRAFLHYAQYSVLSNYRAVCHLKPYLNFCAAAMEFRLFV